MDGVRSARVRLQELERDDIAGLVYAFAEQMRTVRKRLALVDKLRDMHQRERWFLSAVTLYCEAVTEFDAQLQDLEPGSAALRGLAEHLRDYIASDTFRELTEDTSRLQGEFDQIRPGPRPESRNQPV